MWVLNEKILRGRVAPVAVARQGNIVEDGHADCVNNWPGGRDQALSPLRPNPKLGSFVALRSRITVALYKHHLESWRRVRVKCAALRCVVTVAPMPAMRQ